MDRLKELRVKMGLSQQALADKLNVSQQSICKYENDTNSKDPIKVITLKKIDSNDGKGSNIVARNVTGKYVYENRKAFEFEVRL